MREVSLLLNNKDDPNSLHIGDYYLVQRSDGTSRFAELIEIRKQGDSDVDEYYVHYEGCDRRLDEWVSLDKIDLSSRRPADDSLHSCLDGSENGSEDSERRKMTRNQKRKHDEVNSHVSQQLDEMDPASAALEREHKEITKVKYIDVIRFGGYNIDTWYFSPFPDEVVKLSKLYICEFCLRYMKLEESYRKHTSQCKRRFPPGTEIYRKGSLSVYEINGSSHKVYCQCLCLLAKLFLDHKTLYYDVDPFMFYILCEVERNGSHLVGYFSKEKESPDNNNLACIMILPPYQRKGYGKFLIQLSYELSKREGIIGSPEKPLSDLGQRSYRSYWAHTILEVLKNKKGTVKMKEISDATGIAQIDVVNTLQALNMTKFWIKQHVVCVTPKLIETCLSLDQFKPPKIVFDPSRFDWSSRKTMERRSVLRK